jgi:streptogramin lyase
MTRIAPFVALCVLVGGIAGPVSPVAARAPAADQATVEPTNALPNPYQTIEGWAKLPVGRSWGSTSAVYPDRDGARLWIAERCGTNSCADSNLPPILHFDSSGNLLKAFGEGLFLTPHGIFVDREDNVWVTDCACTQGGGTRGRGAAAPQPPPGPARGHQIFKFSPDGALLLTLGKPGGGRDPDFYWQPTDLLIAPDGAIFVSEGHSSGAGSTARVLKFSRDGTLLRTFGSLGAGPTELNQPHTLAMDSRGRLFVGDRANNRIQIFDQNFTLLDTWYQFSRPSGIFIDAADTIYVTDSESESVARNHDGWKRGIRIGSARDGSVKYFIPDPVEHATNTSAAEGVAVDAAGHIYGAEVGSKSLKRYVKTPPSLGLIVPLPR